MRKYESVLIFILIIILTISFSLFGQNLNKKMTSENSNNNQEEQIKSKTKQKNEKIKPTEPNQEKPIRKDANINKKKLKKSNQEIESNKIKINELNQATSIYRNVIDTYRDTINFYKWIITLFIVVLVGFGVIVWRKYKILETHTRKNINEFQERAKKKVEELTRKIEDETMKIENTGGIIIGVFFFSMGKMQDAIPYLERTLSKKIYLTEEQKLIIHITLGSIYANFGNIPRAMEHSDVAIKLNPNLSFVRILRSKTLQLARDYRGALKEIELVENLAISEKYPQEALSQIYIFHGTLLAQNKDYKKAKEIFERENVTVENLMLSVPFESPQWLAYDRIKKEAENGIRYLEIRELLKDKFKSEPKEEEINTIVTGMRLAPFANKIELLNQIFEDKEFITKLKKMFSENLSRLPKTWEILNFGDKWLAKNQAKKDIDEIIKEELEMSPEFKIRNESEKKYNKLLKQ